MKRKVTKAKTQVITPLKWQAFVDRYLFVLPREYFKDLERLISGKKSSIEIPHEVIEEMDIELQKRQDQKQNGETV